ncbi:uncharacterized protein TRAVEDRAFT_75758 [Trametes versicolor FP-101664 SS1]|uniref:Uncharacterized protein n=1 Tax=Trametes versicolor (strain FP-101664) TaxID=717944 RepID=R7S6J7_TRAVS|nr:uncharacterized protein TRAVEDRAFT_75758 [Trametes versicolor FP-101664 SS1]EIW51190.1 hypothetical protein TRAVEDRAFT_75758 [Trametes versicolor FP-101664 SS1]
MCMSLDYQGCYSAPERLLSLCAAMQWNASCLHAPADEEDIFDTSVTVLNRSANPPTTHADSTEALLWLNENAIGCNFKPRCARSGVSATALLVSQATHGGDHTIETNCRCAQQLDTRVFKGPEHSQDPRGARDLGRS